MKKKILFVILLVLVGCLAFGGGKREAPKESEGTKPAMEETESAAAEKELPGRMASASFRGLATSLYYV